MKPQTAKMIKEITFGDKSKPKNTLALDLEGVVDVLDAGDHLVYLTTSGEVVDNMVIDDVTYTPPSKSETPYLFPDKQKVLDLIKSGTSGTSGTSGGSLYTHLLEYHKRISDLPDALYYDLLALWDFHTYFLDKLHFSPILYLYAVRERGKSRTGKGCLYISRRGVFTETVREPDIIRWGNDHKAALGFDVKDFPKKIKYANCDDLILARFEKGSTASRTLFPDRGAFRDTKTFRLFGPTVVMTNRPVDDIVESRAISIDMKPTTRMFHDPVIPEDALELKADLTAFRFLNKDTKLKKPDKPLSGRLGDIVSPLQQIVYTFFPEKLDNFTKLLHLIAEKKQEDALDSLESQIVDAVIAGEAQVVGGFLSVEEISNTFNQGKSEKFVLSNEIIGRILKGLGFTLRKTTGGKRGIYYDTNLIQNITSQYGLGCTPKSPPLPPLPQSSKGEVEAKNEEWRALGDKPGKESYE